MASAARPAPEPARLLNAPGITDWRDANSIFWPIAALSILLVLQFTLVFTRAINWDEFFFFHEVAKFAGGELDRPLQTIHVRLFSWLPALYDNNVDAIVTARIAMFAFELVALASIIRIGSHLAGLRIGVFAALLYLSAGYVLQHGTSFRVDPMLAGSLMAALAILATTRLRWPQILAFGLIAAFAGMVSIKAVLYAPAFAAVAWMRWEEAGFGKARFARIAACALTALVFFALLYLWHASALPDRNDALTQGGEIVGASGGWSFFLGIPPYWQMALKSALIAPVLYGCIVAAPFMILRAQASKSARAAALGFWLPITSLLFYTNTAAYFYVFILAPVALGCLLPLRWLIDRYGSRLVAIALLVMAGCLWFLEDRDVQDRQRDLVANVHELFPQGVAYIDQSYMMAGWPKANNFMTPWGMSGYRAAGQPAYRETMEDRPVPLLIANSPELQAMMEESERGLLLPEDEAAIRDNFILHSWPLWVAGKYLEGETVQTEEFLVPGTYTVSGGRVTIDEREYRHGDTVHIARGLHRVWVPGTKAVTLTWGDHLPEPSQPLASGPIHVAF